MGADATPPAVGLTRRFEMALARLRHHRWLANADWLWDRVRPVYNRAFTASGVPIVRNVNGTDRLVISPEVRGSLSDVYEPEVWPRIMAAVKPGGTIVDVGANMGIYAIAFAKRVGSGGRVHAFEPDPENVRRLREHIALNAVEDRVTGHEMALSDTDGTTSFVFGKGSESRLGAGSTSVRVARLDSVLGAESVDLLKIDVEGFEEHVLRGAMTLLNDPVRRPQLISIEVHPFNWELAGTSSDSLLQLLASAGFRVEDLERRPVERIHEYGEIFARPF